MALAQATIEWDARPYVEEVRKILNQVVRDGAEATAEDAKKSLERHFRKKVKWSEETKSTGNLAESIAISASKFTDGGWIVSAQGGGTTSRAFYYKNIAWGKGGEKFYASFVELGTSKMEAMPYLRPALRRNRFRMRRMIANALGAIVR